MRLKWFGCVCGLSGLLVACGKEPSAGEPAVATAQESSGPKKGLETSLVPPSAVDAPRVDAPKLSVVMVEDYLKIRPPKRKTRDPQSPQPAELKEANLTPESFRYIDELVDKIMKDRGERISPQDVMEQMRVTGAEDTYRKALDDTFGHILDRSTLSGAVNAEIDTNKVRQDFDERFALGKTTNAMPRATRNPFKRTDQDIANEKLVRQCLTRLLGEPRNGLTSRNSRSPDNSPAAPIPGMAPGEGLEGLFDRANTRKAEQESKKKKREEEAQAQLMAAVAGLQSTNSTERVEACDKIPERDLGELAGQITPRLVWMLGQTNMAEQMSAASALGKMKPFTKEAKAALLAVLKGSGPVKLIAAESMLQAAPEDSEIKAALMSDPEFGPMYQFRQKARLIFQPLQPTIPKSPDREAK